MIINNVANYLNFFRIAMPRFLDCFTSICEMA